MGLGLEASGTSGSVTFKDPLSFVNPDIFNGDFFSAGAAFSLPPTTQGKLGQVIAGQPNANHGFSASAIRLGNAGSVQGGEIKGLSIGIGFLLGTSTVISSTTENCSCK